MYILIKARLASMWELKNCYTLDEALKLYALYRMEQDVEAGRVEDAHNAIFKTLVKERLGEKEYMKLIEEANTELEAYEISGQMWDGYSRAHGKSVTSINKL